MNILLDKIDEQPYFEPGLVHRLDEAYFKKIDAIEFAVKYDDGKDHSYVLNIVIKASLKYAKFLTILYLLLVSLLDPCHRHI